MKLLIILITSLLFSCNQDTTIADNFISDVKNKDTELIVADYFFDIPNDKQKEIVIFFLKEFKKDLKDLDNYEIRQGNSINDREFFIDHKGEGNLFTVMDKNKLIMFVIVKNKKIISFFTAPMKVSKKVTEPFIIKYK